MMEYEVGRFRAISKLSLLSVYLLIIAGGVVRSTGSGMGCPDWPKCFGRWIPPTEVSQLDGNYKDIYAQKRKNKNYKVAAFLRTFQFDQLATTLEGDNSFYQEMDFNPLKTWIEYLNRLLGVVVGFCVLALAVYSIKLFGAAPALTIAGFTTLVLVAAEGWMGSLVVSTNLLPSVVTLHMAGALAIILLLIYILVRTQNRQVVIAANMRTILSVVSTITVIMVFVQIILGTQVREDIDVVAVSQQFINRQQWISQLGDQFMIHRSFSIAVVAIHAFLYYLLKSKSLLSGSVKIAVTVITVCLVAETMIGIGLSYFGVPPVLQPAHLLLGCVLFGADIYLFFYLMAKNSIKLQAT